MAGGGSAPSMKMSDVFLLVGMSVILGGLIMHVWTTPTSLDENTPTLENGASMMQGDTLTFEINPTNASTITISVENEDGELVVEETWSKAEGENFEYVFDADAGGFYTYEVTFNAGEGEAYVDVNRSSMIDFVAYPIGIACIAFGVYKRTMESDEVMDAELEG